MDKEEAIKILKDFHDKSALFSVRTALETLHPELKESEDERVRKGLITAVSGTLEGNKLFGTDVTREEALAWLEKQGEQKPSDKPKFEIGDEIKTDNEDPLTITKIDEQGYWSGDLFICNSEDSAKWELVGKHINKLESKFKVGDWILYSGDHYEGVRHITKIDENGYYIERNGLPHGIIPFNHEVCMRLWTIKDAKPGDVLINWNNTIFIFKAIEDETVKFHIAYNEKWDAIKIPLTKLSHLGLSEPQFEFHPATKEQRDLLFTKMKEAGYAFDFEKKELKKIEDEEYNGEDYCIDSLYHAQRILEKTLGEVDGYQSDDGILSHQCAITAVKKLYEQKPAEWSEEDEYMLNETIQHLEELIRIDKTKHCACDVQYYQRDIDWIKLLKDRVQQQPKQEWSKEDEGVLLESISVLQSSCHWVLADKLKSIKQRYTWKPSEEQMNALSIAVKHGQIDDPDALKKLLEQLKKLREE